MPTFSTDIGVSAREKFKFFEDNTAWVGPASNSSPIGVFVGGLYNASDPTYADGDPAVLQFTSAGRLKVDSSLTVEGDIQLGAVEIKDGSADTRTSVTTRGSKGALAVEILDASGNQVTALGYTEASSATVYEVDMIVGNTEYSQALPDNTVAVDIKLRGQGYSLQYSWSSDGDFMTIWPASSRHISGINFSSQTLYLKCSQGNQVAEIEAFTA